MPGKIYCKNDMDKLCAYLPAGVFYHIDGL